MIQRLRKQLIYTRFSIREWWPLWFYILNSGARRKYKKEVIHLTLEQKKVIDNLNKTGIAFTCLDRLFPGEDILSKLQHYAKLLESDLIPNSKKNFIINYWELVPEFNLENPFVSLSLNATILNIAKSYLQMWPRLKYYHLAKAIPVGDAEPTFSQKWHRDPEEKRMVKMFIYLSDVDMESGPFTYILNSVYGNTYGKVGPQKPPEGSYPDTAVIDRLISTDAIYSCTGLAGTIIFCDTSGLHFGGHATSKERLMFTASYNAPTFSEPSRYKFTKSDTFTVSQLPIDAQYALGGELMKK